MRSSSDNLAYPGKEETAPARHALRIRAPRATARSADPHSSRPRRLVELGVQAPRESRIRGLHLGRPDDASRGPRGRYRGRDPGLRRGAAPSCHSCPARQAAQRRGAAAVPHKSITGVITWSRTHIGRKYGRARRAHFVAVPRNSSGASKFAICSRRPYLTRILWSPPVLILYLATDHGAQSNELPRVVIFMLVLSAASCSSHRPTGTEVKHLRVLVASTYPELNSL